MKYTSNFYSLRGDRYDVTIVTNNDTGTTREITLGVPAFVTEQDTSSDNIYKSLKCQSATVNIVTEDETDYMFDLYSGQANGTRVTLSRSGETIWDGFATPVLYNNGFTEIHENIELECIDGLAVLQYYKYSADTKQVLSFIEIVNKVLERSEVYNYLYVSHNTRLDSFSNYPILNELYISEQNFFDEKKDKETDDDVAWTCQEVLEEICKFLGLVCVSYGDSVYLLDLDAINHNINTFVKYEIGSTSYTTVQLSDTIAIEQSKYRGGNNTISLDNVYNKVSVKDSFYTFDSVIKDLYDTKNNITKATDPDLSSSTNVEKGMYGTVVQGYDGNMIVLLDRIYNPEDEEYSDYNFVFVKYYTNDNYILECPDEMNYTDSKTLHGAVIAKFSVIKMERDFSYWEEIAIKLKNGEITIDDYLQRNSISNPTFKNYLCLLNPIEGHDSSGTTYLTTNSSDMSCLFGGENSFLIIQGDYNFHYFDEDPYPIPSDEADISEGRYAMEAGQTYLLAKLKWGNQYWNGSAWTYSNSTFQIPYMKADASADERRADATMFKDLEFVNTVSWRIGTTEKGYLIPTPDDKVMNGMPELTIYSPNDPDYRSTSSGDFEGKWYKHTRVFLKNFDIKAFVGDPTFENANDSDTVFTNVIDDNYAQEFDEVEFKICTNDNKNPNYSSVAYQDGGNFRFLENTYNEALGMSKKQEEHFINRFCNQYKNPRIRLKLSLEDVIKPWTILTDKWLPNKRFIVDAQGIDYQNDVTQITLVEKA